MKNFKYLIAFIAIVSILITGCSNPLKNEEQYIKVQKRLGDEANYEDYKEITNNDQVQQVKEIVGDIKWENAKVNMVRPADYRFLIQYKNPEIEAKAVLYELWINQNSDKVEIVIDAEMKYIQLDNKQSAELFELLTGEKIAEP